VSPVTTQVQPGDWFVVDTGNEGIEFGERLVERLTGGPKALHRWTHAGVATRWRDGKLHIVEATPNGAVETPWHWEGRPHAWSTGTGLSVRGMAEAAHGYIGTPYSFADYAAIGLHALHVPAPGLKSYIASTHSMICSQLVDQCAQDCGVHLFDDRRWPGYIPPSDLGILLERDEHLEWVRGMKGKGLQWPG
jgi:hypothetical protein